MIKKILHKYWEHPRAPYYNEREGGGKQRMQAVKLHAHKKDARPACTHMHPQHADNAGDNKEKKEKRYRTIPSNQKPKLAN